MKAIIDTKIFSGILSAANGVAPRDASIQIKAIRPDAASNLGIVKVMAYDSTTVCALEGPAQIEEEGSLALRGQPLERFLKASLKSDATVLLEKKPTNERPTLRVSTARAAHEFDTLSDETFQQIDPGQIDRPNGNLSALAQAMARALSACPHSDEVSGSRLAMSGVHIAERGQEIHVVGTDGKRLSWSALTASNHPSVAFHKSARGYTIPRSLVPKIISMIDNTPARIDFDEDSLIVANNAGVLAMRLIDATYPAYDGLTKINPPHIINVSRNSLITALDRSSASIGGDDKNSAATLFRNQDGLHLLSSTSQESSSETIDEKGGEEVRISFDASFMKKALSQIPTELLRIRVGDKNTPIMIDHETRPDILMLVMPYKTLD